MLHMKRRWCVAERQSAEVLARDLVERTWTLCTGFRIGGCVFLNDSTSEDGAQEYALVKRGPSGTWTQHESITFGWCDEAKALEHIRRAIAGEYDGASYGRGLELAVETPEEHDDCDLCA